MAYKIRILPRWLVFLLDLFLVCFCLFLARALKMNFSWPHVVVGLRSMTVVVLLLNAALFYIFKSYAGIVRYTNIEDTSRLVMVNAIASFFYLAVNIFVYHSQNFFTLQVVTINFFITSFVIISYRLAVRYCFQFYKLYSEGEKVPRKKVAVYNASANGLHIKNVMNNLPNGDMQVVAFLDDNLSGNGKLLEGIPIYTTNESNIEKLKNEGVELVIFVNKITEKDKLNALVDNCLHYGIRIQQVPTMRDWLNGKLDTQQLQNINIEDLLEREVIKIHNEAIYTELKGKKILVTGAAGSIGSELVRQLLNYRPSLIILCDQAETPMHEFTLEIQEKYKNANIKAYLGDITDRQRMEHLFEVYNPQIVFHAAAYKHVPLMEDNPSIAVMNNVLGTKNLAELSVANDVEKFVMISTDKAVNPTNVMGASKRIAEIFTQSFYRSMLNDMELHKEDGTPHITKFVTTRFGNVLGSNGSVIPRFKMQLEKGGPITVTHPEITRYFMTIPEACILVLEAGVMGQGGEIFVFDMGKPVKIADLAKKVIRLAGKEPDVDIQIVYSGLRPGEKLYEELLNNAENTRPTYHEKILIADVREYNFADVSKRVEKLIACAKQHYTLETVYLMKDLVPEFVSTNVAYEKVNATTK
ncbi:polysaccharide biosynthesis protein [Flavipsychrobacter stenotrophus]|uniref:Polysaccharide biosynthesis protein n=1 Tax=Flavipsychrobacter stenotrophus TaxID=2077091 RepID=A0A2S7SS64_9BACT|nr:nucleoside-diphosphate sugar epimerase/dehydratase [Flavipsychrobacter stenotrophus]PQJ09558.1 polysaccharide biosynthesis protein [Flavipsychrobacter stenotrophus]